MAVTVPQGLNVRALPTEFRRLAENEGVNRAMIRLVANFGEPWGRDKAMGEIMATEWERALAHLPAVVLDAAVSEWVDKNTQWPKPAHLLAIASRTVARKVEEASERHGLHPRRIDPAETMKGFLYVDSTLRTDPTWRRFLDSVHPTAEHCFFQKAKMTVPHELHGLTSFEAEYVKKNFGKQLTEMFKRPVMLGVGPLPCRIVEWTDEPWTPQTPEAKARVSKMVREFVERNRMPGQKISERKCNFEGASPEFLDLIGEGRETPAPNQPQSPPTATGDFDGCSDVQS